MPLQAALCIPMPFAPSGPISPQPCRVVVTAGVCGAFSSLYVWAALHFLLPLRAFLRSSALPALLDFSTSL